MGYATAEFYKTEYHGNSIPDDILQGVLDRASDEVDILTRRKIHKLGGFSQLSKFEQNQVRLAVCHQADHLHTKASLEGLSSYSIGDVSVSFDTSAAYNSQCVSYLGATRLMYRGL